MKQYLRFLSLGLFVFPLLLVLQPVRSAVLEWLAPVIIDSGHDPLIAPPSMSIVNGKPAMVYVVQGNGKYTLSYQQSLDIDGANWMPFEQRVAVHESTSRIYGSSLAEVNGRPAIIFNEEGVLKYVQAGDEEGATWEAPITLLSEWVGTAQLFVIDGAPTILYQTQTWDGFDTINLLWYLRAKNADGTNWNLPVNVVLDGTFSTPYSVTLVNGLPAVAYADGENLKYARAKNSGGGNWTNPVIVHTGETDYDSISLTSQALSHEGRPALGFTAGNDRWDPKRLYYVEAKNKNGTSWNKAEILVNAGGEERVDNVTLADMGEAPFICYRSSYLEIRCFASDNYDEPVSVPGGSSIVSLLRVNGNPAIGTTAYYDGIYFSRAFDTNGATWYGPYKLADRKTVGYPSALSEVEGLPAAGYYHDQSRNLLYSQSRDSAGVAWATPVVVDDEGDVGRYHSLAVVNGNPAFSYFGYLDYLNGHLKYVRALDPSGATWGEPVIVDSNGDVGRGNFLTVIDGRPAIGYYTRADKALKFVRAADTNGETWNDPAIIEGTENIDIYTPVYSFALVGGRMGVVYKVSDESELMYSQAQDADGQNWSAPVVVDAKAVGEYVSLQEINGRPAVVFLKYNDTEHYFQIYYSRADDADGSAWGNPILVEDMVNSPSYQLQVFLIQKGDKPLIVFRNNGLFVTQAEDEDGANWGESEPVLGGHEYFNNTMRSFATVIDGCPSISFHTYPDLAFTRMNCPDKPATPTPTTPPTPTATPEAPMQDAYIPVVIK